MAHQQEDRHRHPSCCISHLFHSAASANPSKISVIHAARHNPNLSPSDRSVISSSPRIYEGDEFFTCADILFAVESFSHRIRRVLDGGDDPDLVRPKGFVDQQQSSNENHMMSQLAGTGGNCSFNGNIHIVGVHFAPSVEYIIAVLSVLRCGEAFMPLDPLWPEERILSVVSSSRTSLVIGCPPFYYDDGCSTSYSADWIVDRSDCSVLHLFVKADLVEHLARSKLVWPCERRSLTKFCYLMYTSGSTGKPKGVCGTEKGLLNRFWWMEDRFPLQREDVLLFKTSISFVDHLQEFLSAILTSTALIIPPFDKSKANPLYFVDLIEVYEISRLTAVPSLMRAIVPSKPSRWVFIRKSLKVLVLSGEILSISFWKVLHELLPETTILNLYGSTEVSGDCTYFDCKNLSDILDVQPLTSVPIGQPIYNCEVELIGETYETDEGEILVGGACLFMGYFEDLFYGHPIKEDYASCHFRTGDFAKRLKSGDFVFLGRKDRTVKINGQRVALEEIENVIREHPEVSDAAVFYQKAHRELPDLQAFFVPKVIEKFQKGQVSAMDQQIVEMSIASIRSWLVRKLPVAMIPAHFFSVELLPKSSTGKINYAVLSSSTDLRKRLRDEYENTLSFEEHLQYIKKAFSTVLLVDEVSDDDDFFMLGGNSISAAHAAHKLGIDMRLLYIFPTPFKLLKSLLDQRKSHEIIPSYSPVSFKRAKVLDVLTSSDSSKNNTNDIRLLGGPSNLNSELRNRNLLEPHNAKQRISHFKKNGGPPFNAGPSISASFEAVSVSGQDHLWISKLGLPTKCSLTRFNQILICRETELSSMNQACLLVKVPRYAKGCLQQLWKVLLKSCVDASPLVVYNNGIINVFIGSHSHIFLCIDAISGSTRWEVKLHGRVECSAAITGDFSQVVVGCYKGKVYFLDYMAGTILWEFQTSGEVKVQPVVDIHRNLTWCGSHDHCLYALNYIQHCCVYKISCGGSIYGSPSIDVVQNMVYVASTNGHVSGIAIEALPFKMIWSNELGAPIFGSVLMDSSRRNVICCLVDGHVVALDSGGDAIWKVGIGGPIFAGACISSALPSQVLICSRNGSVYSLDVEGGDVLWEYQVGDPITASAYVDEQTLLETEPDDPCDRLACVCSSSGRIHVFRINSNAKQERACSNGEVTQSRMVKEFAVMDLSGEIFSSPVMIGGRIFVGCRDDYVHCIDVLI